MEKILTIFIPGLGELKVKYLTLDLNGTLALDGRLLPGVREGLLKLSDVFEKIYILTADTHGTAEGVFKDLAVQLYKISSQTNGAAEKQAFIKKLGGQHCVAIGNGVNDSLMFTEAVLSICILGGEGTALNTLLQADIIVKDIKVALDLFLFPNRLVATLRK
jgi:soluble P-type ATPase